MISPLAYVDPAAKIGKNVTVQERDKNGQRQ